MTIRRFLAGGVICCGAALAWQTTPATPEQPTTPEQQQTTPAQRDQQTTPAPDNRDRTETSTQTSSQSGTTTSSDRMPEIKTQKYKGALVDASCAMPGSSGTGSAARSETPAQTDSEQTAAAGSGTQNRTAGGDSCTVSSSTTRFALRTKDGKTLPFDSVGNDRAQLAMKNKKKWTDAAQAGKPVNVTVSGAMSGEKLTVVTIN